MGFIDILLGVVFTVAVGAGFGLGAMGDAGNIEFWIARGGFVVAAMAICAAFFYWLSEGERDNRLIVLIGTIAGLWIFVGLPFQLKWVEARETKIRGLASAADVSLRFVHPRSPAVVLINQSGHVARQIKWTVAIWNLDLPDRMDPLPIPIQTFDFIRPHLEGGPQNIFGSSLVAPLLNPGNRLIGSASVQCPDCSRGRTFVVYIVWDQGGWFAELPEITSGEIIIPPHFTKKEIQEYATQLLATVPESARVPIRGNQDQTETPTKYIPYDIEIRLRAIDEIFEIFETKLMPVHIAGRDFVNNIRAEVEKGNARQQILDHSKILQAAIAELHKATDKYSALSDISDALRTSWNYAELMGRFDNVVNEIDQLSKIAGGNAAALMDRTVAVQEWRAAERQFLAFIVEKKTVLKQLRKKYESAPVHGP